MICSACPKETMTAVDGLCKGCRLRAASKRRQKYVWTPDRDAALRRAYQAKNKAALTVQLAGLRRRTGWPRLAFSNRAQSLGLRIFTTNRWKAEEVQAIQELAGEVPLHELARRINRSPYSVMNKMHTMGIESRFRNGFSRNELASLMGVVHGKVERWTQRGWLQIDEYDRITHESVSAFLWARMEDYRFAACDEWWLKTMLKPLIGVRPETRKPARKEAA